MKVRQLHRRDRRRMSRALRQNEPIVLELQAPPPPEVRLDDIVPLCHTVQAWNPALTRKLQVFLPPPARPGHRATVTAIIPTHRHSPLGLDALRGQDIPVQVLVLANGPAAAKDGAIAGDRVVALPWQGHGRTRQRGVELADSEYILFTVDDAIPMGAGFVRVLVEALEAHSFDAVFARQIPWPDASPVTFHRLRSWTPPGHVVQPVAYLDNVAALYRRDTLLRSPLPPVPIAEDLHWARSHRIGYVPMAPVLHSHLRRPGALLSRTRAIHRQHLLLGDPPRVASLSALLGALPGMVAPVLEGGPMELLNQGAELLGQWLAAHERSS